MMKGWTGILRALALCCLAALLAVYQDATAQEGTYDVKVGPRGVHFRATPENDTTGKNILGTIHAFEVLRALERLEGWHRVVYQGQEGYVSASYVRIIGEAPAWRAEGNDQGQREDMPEALALPEESQPVRDFGTGWASASNDELTLRALKFADDPRTAGDDYPSYGGIPVEAWQRVGEQGARLRYSPYDRQDAAVLRILQAGVRVYVYCLFEDEWAGTWAYVTTTDGTLGFIAAGLLE